MINYERHVPRGGTLAGDAVIGGVVVCSLEKVTEVSEAGGGEWFRK